MTRARRSEGVGEGGERQRGGRRRVARARADSGRGTRDDVGADSVARRAGERAEIYVGGGVGVRGRHVARDVR